MSLQPFLYLLGMMVISFLTACKTIPQESKPAPLRVLYQDSNAFRDFRKSEVIPLTVGIAKHFLCYTTLPKDPGVTGMLTELTIQKRNGKRTVPYVYEIMIDELPVIKYKYPFDLTLVVLATDKGLLLHEKGNFYSGSYVETGSRYRVQFAIDTLDKDEHTLNSFITPFIDVEVIGAEGSR